MGIAETDMISWVENGGSNVYSFENMIYTQACVDYSGAMTLTTASAMLMILGVLI